MGADWTDEEDAIVVELYRACGARGLSRTALRHRTEASINSRAHLLMHQGRVAPGKKGGPEESHSIARRCECDDDIVVRIRQAHLFKLKAARAGKPDAELTEDAM